MSHKKFGPDRFSRFDVYWIQTDRQTNRQTDKPNLYIDYDSPSQQSMAFYVVDFLYFDIMNAGRPCTERVVSYWIIFKLFAKIYAE